MINLSNMQTNKKYYVFYLELKNGSFNGIQWDSMGSSHNVEVANLTGFTGTAL